MERKFRWRDREGEEWILSGEKWPLASERASGALSLDLAQREADSPTRSRLRINTASEIFGTMDGEGRVMLALGADLATLLSVFPNPAGQ